MPPINWDMDLLSNETGVLQDINFNGDKTVLVAGTNEWAQIDLRQVGSRRNVASHAIADAVGPLSLDNGQGDNGQGDNGQGDNGQGDNGQGDNGQGDNGAPPEVDPEAASDGPHQRKPAFAKQQGLAVILSWTQSHVGPAVSFEVWRSVGTTISAAKTLIGITSAPTTTLSDGTVKPKETYTYVVVGIQADGTRGISNPQTITIK